MLQIVVMNNRYGGVIWTNHALQRLTERGVSQEDAWYTFQHPQQSRYAASKGGWIYYRTYGNQKIEVVAKQNEKKEWIIMSVWSRYNYGKPSANSNNSQSIITFLFKKLFNR